MKTVLFVVFFTIAFVCGLFAERAYFRAFDAVKTRFTDKSLTYPTDAFCFIRNEPISGSQVDNWKTCAQLDTPDTPLAIYSLGMYYSYLREEPQEAISCFERVLREFPSTSISAGALFECGLARMNAGEEESGLSALELFVAKYPNSWRRPAALMYIALHHRDNGDSDRCCAILEQIFRESPSSPQSSRAASIACSLLRENGEYEHAARIALLEAGSRHSSVKSAQALSEWLVNRAKACGSKDALVEFDAYFCLIRGGEARRLVLQAAIETAFSGGLEATELRYIIAMLNEGLPHAKQPPILWRKYELEFALQKASDASATLTQLTSEFSDTPEGRRAGSELNRIMSAGFGR